MSVLQMSIAEAAEALRRRKLSSLDLVEAALAEAERTNPKINAFLRIDGDHARFQARAADKDLARGHIRSPLHGVPLAHKDMFFRSGVPSSCGSKVKLPVPDRTSTALARLDAAGAIQIGVLNMSPFAVGPTGHNDSVGHCRNPWDVRRISGGSSSGSAAAVAARVCFAALGSDTAGSIRLPAAICGVTGLKPTYGRVSRAGIMSFSYTLDTVGPIARTARDCALLMNAVAGPDDADPTTAQVHASDVLSRISHPVKGTRIGVPSNYFTDDLSPEIARHAESSHQVLRDLGCQIVPVEVPDLQTADTAAGIVLACEGAAVHHELMREEGECYGQQMRIRLERGFAIPAPTYVDALRYRDVALAQIMRDVFAKVDMLHTPVLPIQTPILDNTSTETSADVDELVGRLTRLTRPINFLGLPAIVLPMGFGGDSMPLSMQLIGRPFAEADLLRVGHAYQQVTSWHMQSPPI